METVKRNFTKQSRIIKSYAFSRMLGLPFFKRTKMYALSFFLLWMIANQAMSQNIGAAAPDFNLQDLSGTTTTLSEYKGKLVVLFFFGNNCPSCKAVAPSIQSDLQDVYGSRNDFILLGLDQWNGNASSVQSFKSSTGVSFPLLLNAGSVSTSYSTTYDRLLIVDPQGILRFKGNQVATNDLQTVKDTVAARLLPLSTTLEGSLEKSWSWYNNNFSRQITFNDPDEEIIEARLMNLNGQVLFIAPWGRPISYGGIPEGIYLLSVQLKTGNTHKKVFLK